jgi:hypothetical protein
LQAWGCTFQSSPLIKQAKPWCIGSHPRCFCAHQHRNESSNKRGLAQQICFVHLYMLPTPPQAAP